MRNISTEELFEITGGFKINIGQALAALAIGFVTGGPAGLGIAASGLVMAQGINNLNEMHEEENRR